MSTQKLSNGNKVLHFDAGRICTKRRKEKRGLILECHLHKAILKQRLAMAFDLIKGKPIHLVMKGVGELRMGDRIITEIEL